MCIAGVNRDAQTIGALVLKKTFTAQICVVVKDAPTVRDRRTKTQKMKLKITILIMKIARAIMIMETIEGDVKSIRRLCSLSAF
jgi:cbb3-type cytochrome oxidase subunit 1